MGARTPIGMIEGAEALGTGKIWYPDIPLVEQVDVKAGVTNEITTIGVVRQNGLEPLKFKCPENITTAAGDNLKRDVYYVTNQLDNVKFFDLREKDTTYAYSYIVYYNYYSDTVIMEYGVADGSLDVPTLPPYCIKIEVKVEPAQGDAYTPGTTDSPDIVYKTHAELLILAANNQLIAGQVYEVTDYATKHDINDSTNTSTSTIHTEAVEPLLLFAISNNKFHKQVFSKQYPKDIIHYDIDNILCEDSTTARKGIITYRKDEWKNETYFDFRGTKVYNGSANVYVFANSRNPGSSSFYGNKIGISSEYNTFFLFGTGCYSNTFGNNCYSNTFGDDCYSNTLENGCNRNTFGDDCYSNTLGVDCNRNTFGDYCYSNTFGVDCNRNTFGVDCSSNTFGNYNRNTFGNDCNSNTFGNNCYSNTFGNDCDLNTLGNGCYSIIPDTGNTDNILNTTFENGVGTITYEAAATHLYATYHKVVFMYPDGTKKLRYFDNSGVLQVVDVND